VREFSNELKTIIEILDQKVAIIDKASPHANSSLDFENELREILKQLKRESAFLNSALESPANFRTFLRKDFADELCRLSSNLVEIAAKKMVAIDQWILRAYLHQFGIYSEVWKHLKAKNPGLTLSKLAESLTIEVIFDMANAGLL
jgi:phage terminase small subunit